MSRITRFLTALGLPLALSCGGGQKEAKPVTRQTAADEILRIGSVWSSTLPEKGLLSPPSPISLFKNSRDSEVTLAEDSANETLTIHENLQLRSGGEVHCSTTLEHTLKVRYGRRGGEAAVELTRPAISAQRNCQGMHPDGSLDEEAKSALFVLRADTLVAVEPPLEKRKYLPIPQ